MGFPGAAPGSGAEGALAIVQREKAALGRGSAAIRTMTTRLAERSAARARRRLAVRS